jgi:hypothetical protein
MPVSSKVMTERRSVTISSSVKKLCKAYMQANYSDDMQGCDIIQLVDRVKIWITSKGYDVQLSGNGYNNRERMMEAVLARFIRYKSLHSKYVQIKEATGLQEKDLAKYYGYASVQSWLGSVNRERRIIEIVNVWGLIEKVCDPKRLPGKEGGQIIGKADSE